MENLTDFFQTHPIAPITVFLVMIIISDILIQVTQKARFKKQTSLAKAFERAQK